MKKTKFRPFLLALLGILVTFACKGGKPLPLTTPTPTRGAAMYLDCTADNPACPELVIQGDEEFRFPNGQKGNFAGFADPTIRQDAQSGRLWLAYSWPNLHRPEPNTIAPGVDIHLAHSDDGGDTWQFDMSLWTSHADEGKGKQSGQPGVTSYEVANLLPIPSEENFRWIGARLAYFVPNQGGFKERPVTSFRVLISQAESPAALADAPFMTLGASWTDPGWDVDLDLTSLSAELKDIIMWNEPALFFENGQLYLALRGLAFNTLTKAAIMEKSPLVVFATTPTPDVRNWEWRYVGRLAGHEEAQELGGEGLTQIDFAYAQDGTPLVLVTLDDWSPQVKDFIHFGLFVLELESIDPPRLKRNADGSLVVRAEIRASDLGIFGPAASAYDPASSTGILFVRRERGEGWFFASMHTTGLMP